MLRWFVAVVALTCASSAFADAKRGASGRSKGAVARSAATSRSSATRGGTLHVNFAASPPLYGLPPLHIPEVQESEVAHYRASLEKPSRAVPGAHFVSQENEYEFSNARMWVRAKKVAEAIKSALHRVSDPREREQIESVYGSVYLHQSAMTVAMRDIAKQTVERLGPWRLEHAPLDSSDRGFLEHTLTW